MKYLLLASSLTLSLLFSAGSWAWTEVASFDNHSKQYVDFHSIRKANGYVFYEDLVDLLEPDSTGMLSYKTYYQADCELFRISIFRSASGYKLPMGKSEQRERVSFTEMEASYLGVKKSLQQSKAQADTAAGTVIPREWLYPQPDSVAEGILQAVCAH